MGRTEGGGQKAQVESKSGFLNKTRMAVIMGAIGLAVLALVRFVAPDWAPTAFVLLVVGVASSFLSVGRTYAGQCPHCGRRVAYKHAYGARSFRCRKCGKRIALKRNGDSFEFHRA